MKTLLDPETSPGLLATVRASRAVEDQAARDTLIAAARYAAANVVETVGEAAVLEVDTYGDRAVLLTGPGAPLISEAAVVEFAAVLGYSTYTGRKYLADAVELAWRLPRTWARILDGTLTTWRARRVADVTRHLDPEVAAWVDDQVAAHAHKVGVTQLERTAKEAAALFEPDLAAAIAEEAVDHRRCDIDTDPGLFLPPVGAEQGQAAGATAQVTATLDAADALDLEAAVSAIAHSLLDHDTTSDLSLAARRAAALGILGRAYNTGTLTTPAVDALPGTGRVIDLKIHTDTRDLAGTGLIRIGNTRGLTTIEQLDRWATMPGVTVRPMTVIDLNEEITTDSYTPTGRLRTQVQLIDQTCAFPNCNVKAENCDLDHRVPFDQGGKTTTSNLTCLCRRHHRAKTHLGWTYQRLGPGRYRWRSPHGYEFLTSPEGTVDLTPGAAPVAGNDVSQDDAA
ncbi:HNH endonuclease signature motif containing protein [Nocardioides sp.]|uniref:HNH endonuclease signature motif containing protein n=1 Tax=Nocardioides sp. TaxID=35761 RepID=UPI0019CBD8BD|nr:HNH endonuclease signature motif containing protein [Nocardioides sp.]MBC7278563.1 HNH endonuclease [Nocardioides sp.]